MRGKEYLESISYKKILLDLKIEELKELREISANISSAQLSEKVQTSIKNDKMINTIIKLETLDKNIAAIIESISTDRNNAQKLISMMANDKEREILHRKYILNQKWSQISYEMNYTERGAQKLNGRALQSFEKIYQKEFANFR